MLGAFHGMGVPEEVARRGTWAGNIRVQGIVCVKGTVGRKSQVLILGVEN